MLATSRGHSVTPERTPVSRKTPHKSQRILVMEKDVYQLLQEADRSTREVAPEKYQKMFDSLMGNSYLYNNIQVSNI